MSEMVFVEEYRKELAATGYPFSLSVPLTTLTGYMFPLGAIADAAVYYDSVDSIPQLTALEKSGRTANYAARSFRP